MEDELRAILIKSKRNSIDDIIRYIKNKVLFIDGCQSFTYNIAPVTYQDNNIQINLRIEVVNHDYNFILLVTIYYFIECKLFDISLSQQTRNNNSTVGIKNNYYIESLK